MPESPFERILNARSIAFFGASNNPAKMGSMQMVHLVQDDFKGKVWPIHPKEKEVMGRPAYARVEDLPEVPDLAVLVLPTQIVPEMLEACGRKGIRRAVIISGGFRERGPEGRRLEDQVVEIARRYGIRFVGPNCVGVIHAARNFNITVYPYTLGSGPMGLLSQSGTYVTQVLMYVARQGIRYSQAVSLGNEADLDMVDGIEYLGQDPETKAIALYIEGIGRGRAFLETARRVSLKKPLVAYYVGGTEAGARSGASHTGKMGGNDRIHDHLFRQCGVLRAPSVEALYDWAWALATTPIPKGDRVAIISHSGGPVTSMADACARLGLKVPTFSPKTQAAIAPMLPPTGSTANPVDLTYNRNPGAMTGGIPKAVFASGEVDAFLIHGLGGMSGSGVVGASAAATIGLSPDQIKAFAELSNQGLIELKQDLSCPVVISTFSDPTDAGVSHAMRHDIPVYPTPERAASALAALVRYGRWRAGQKVAQA
jgi:acyl-CoA synthetase (NDP forming)